MKTVGETIKQMESFIHQRFKKKILKNPIYLMMYNKKTRSKTKINFNGCSSIPNRQAKQKISDFDIFLTINISKNLQIKIKNNTLAKQLFTAEVNNIYHAKMLDSAGEKLIERKLLCNLN